MIISNQLEDSDIWEDTDVIGVVAEHHGRYRGQGQSKRSC